MKLTPGTWTYNPDFSAVVVIHDHKLKAVADFGKTDLPETEANARVMAASKELLQALELIANHPREEPIPQLIVRFQRIARAAIAKAKS